MLCFVGSGLGQGWDKSYKVDSTLKVSDVSKMLRCKNGGYVLLSLISNGVMCNKANNTNYDLSFCRVDTEGNLLYSKMLGTKDVEETPKCLVEGQDGSFYIVTQHTWPSASCTTISDFSLYKLDKDGNFLWVKMLENPPSLFVGFPKIKELSEIICLDNGNIMLLWGLRLNYPFYEQSDAFELTTEILDTNGSLIKRNASRPKDGIVYLVRAISNYSRTEKKEYAFDLTTHDGGGIASSKIAKSIRLTIDQEGIIAIDSFSQLYARTPTILKNGEKLAFRDIMLGAIYSEGFVIQRFSKENALLKQYIFSFNDDIAPKKFFLSNDEQYIYIVQYRTEQNSGRNFCLKIDTTGKKIWEIEFHNQYSSNKTGDINYSISDAQYVDDYLYLIGEQRSNTIANKENKIWFRKIDLRGKMNKVFGKVYFDENKNCLLDTLEKRAKNNIIEIKEATTNINYYITTDSLGYYEAFVLGDKIMLNPILPSNLWGICPSPVVVEFDTLTKEKIQNIGVQKKENCHYLNIQLSTPRLRRCFPSTYTVHYCNNGTADTNNAYAELDFDPFLEIQGATLPVTSLGGNKYRVELGTVKILECHDFQVTVKVNCDSTVVGQTHCSEARIYPDSLCLPPSSAWDKSNLQATGKCLGNKVQFELKNTGTNAPTQTLEYFIVEDQILKVQAPINLGGGATSTFEFPANGHTYRLTAQQSPNNPTGSTFTTAAVEGCGATPISLGFVTQFSNSDQSPFIDVDCRQNVGAYDPNEKQAAPTGYGSKHHIPINTDIEYQINFQNTGTDTAFTVVVRDTLDVAHLDVTSFHAGASSHPYTYEIVGKGIVKFTFANILLVDSTQNEAASHGFVQYRISQKRDLPLGSRIQNRAAIYFDFNAPVITNTTEHVIGKDYIILAVQDAPEKSDYKVSVSPNPFTESAVITLTPALEGALKIFSVYTLDGRLVTTQTFTNQSFVFNRNVQSGIFIFKIECEGRVVATGKLVEK
jgi:hypothetical protein